MPSNVPVSHELVFAGTLDSYGMWRRLDLASQVVGVQHCVFGAARSPSGPIIRM